MALFSQRAGITPMEKTIQRESIDEDLKNGLWNCLDTCLFSRWHVDPYGGPSFETEFVDAVYVSIWSEHLKQTLDTRPVFRKPSGRDGYSLLRQHFFSAEWHKLFDLIEFVLASEHNRWRAELGRECNRVLERENSAYRVVGQEMTEITSPVEVAEVDEALASSMAGAASHISRALEMLSSRTDPDYRNSIKESISAVESACKQFTGDSSATLGDCVKRMKSDFGMHPALAEGLSKIYGYTCAHGGIRHGLMDDSWEPTFEEAKLMLVLCSAFVNFVTGIMAYQR